MGSSPVESERGLGAVAAVLMAVTALTTLLPWTGGASSTTGLQHDDGFLVLAASVIGVALQRIGAKPAWIAPAFAALVQVRGIRSISVAGGDPGFGILLGVVAATAATAVLIVLLLRSIRAARPMVDG